METVYMMEQGAYIKKDGNSLKILKQGELIDTVPSEGLKKLVLSGYLSLSGPVLDFLIKNRVETVFLTPAGRFRARLMIDEHKHVRLRKNQYIRLEDPDFALKTMKILVRGKLDNMVVLLLRRGRDYQEEVLRSAAAGIKSLAKNLDSAVSKDAVRGIEGAGTRIYYSVFKKLLRNPAFSFKGRNRRPPLDPVNALLSFVYTLLTNEILSAIKTRGLDPYLGALHEIDYGRPSLACDLVEEFRCNPGDRLVLGLLNRKMIKPEDFVFRQVKKTSFVDEAEMKAGRPVEMKPYLRKTFISSYENMMTGSASFRNRIREQVNGFADYILERESTYTPFSQ